jgi:hypothetical protein
MRKIYIVTILLLSTIGIYGQDNILSKGEGWPDKIKQAEKFVKKKEFQSAIELCDDILNYDIVVDKTWMYYNFTVSASDILFSIYSDKKNQFFDEKKALKYLKLNNEHLKLFDGLLFREPYSGSMETFRNSIREILPKSDKELADYLIKTGLTLNDAEPIKNEKRNKENSKDVVLDIISQGKDMNIAINNGLKNAIESAFGTFISTNIQLVNDSLIKDEIVSITNGNIKNYTILKNQQLQNGDFVLNMKVNVSVEKLTSFCESKGIKSEFKGGLFSANIKLQELYEVNELKAWGNAKEILNTLLHSSFDYVIKAPEIPKKINDSLWNVQLNIKVSTNENFNNALITVYNYLKYASLTEDEAINYLNLNKNVYKIVFAISETDFGKFYLRNESVRDEISSLLRLSFKTSLKNIKVDNGIDKFTVKQNVINGSKRINEEFEASILDHTLEYKTLLHNDHNTEFLGIWNSNRSNKFSIKNGYFGQNIGYLYIHCSYYAGGCGVASVDNFDNEQIIKDSYGIDNYREYEEFIKNGLLESNENFNFFRKIKISKVDQMILDSRNPVSFPSYVPAMSFVNLLNKRLFYDLYLNDVRNIEEINNISKYEIVK